MKEVATKIETPTGREMKPIPTKNAVWTHIGNDTCHMLVRLPEWIRSPQDLHDYPQVWSVIQMKGLSHADGVAAPQTRAASSDLMRSP